MIKLITLLLLLNLPCYLNAQITIRNESIVEKPVLKPRVFDSLTNVVMQNRPIDFKKYIGYKLFFMPRSSKYVDNFTMGDSTIQYLCTEKTYEIKKGTHLRSKYEPSTLKTNTYLAKYIPTSGYYVTGDGGITYTPSKAVEGIYFTILDIRARKYTGDPYSKMEDFVGELNYSTQFNISLKNNSTGDTLYWLINYKYKFSDAPFLLVPYFEKQKSLYLNKSLVAISEIDNLIDINTGEVINIKPNDKWDCYDVSITESRSSNYLKPFLFLKNGDREIAIDFEDFEKYDPFILESEFIRREAEKKKKEEELRKEQLAEQKKIEEERKQFVNYCTSKFGPKSGSLIADGKVILGMSREMCKTAWGEPIDINKTILKGLTNEQWVYGYGTYLYFDNGVLSGIQN